MAKEDISKEEEELLVTLGRILIFEFYSGNAPSPKKVKEGIGTISKELKIESELIEKAYLYARQKSEEIAFSGPSRNKIGFT